MKKIKTTEEYECRLSEARAFAKSIDEKAFEAHDPTGDEMNESVWLWFYDKFHSSKIYSREICKFQLTGNGKNPVGIMTVIY